MRGSTIIMIAVAAVFGLLAVFIAQSWLNSQQEARLRSLQAQKPQQAASQTLVVASRQLRFGMELSPMVLREIPWPLEAMPPGAFKSIQQLMSEGKRVVLTAIESNEPILASKITGHGQRATLSAVIGEGRKAVTIRVNDVDGVAGFVLPGDRVDVMLSRQIEKNQAMNDVVLKGARVLAVDQLADDRTEKPSVAKAVTLEVDIAGAQKLALAGQIGTLALALRKAGDTEATASRPITLADLIGSKSGAEGDSNYSTIGVTRASTRTVYSVPRADINSRANASVGQGHTR